MSFDDRPRKARSNVVPSGCVLGASLLVIVVAIAGYFGYRYFAGALDLPEELEPYTEADSVRAQVRSHAPRPPAATRLDRQWLALYVDGLDSIGGALLDTRDVIDSMYRSAQARGDTGITVLVTSPTFFRAMAIIAPSTKRALVDYLNGRGRSLDEYHWAKERTLAATDITRETADSTLRAMIGRFFNTGDAKLSLGGDAIDVWFERIDSLRSSGAIGDDERALALPMRQRILERGLASLYGFDTDFKE
jgi:hypothetical protein